MQWPAVLRYNIARNRGEPHHMRNLLLLALIAGLSQQQGLSQPPPTSTGSAALDSRSPLAGLPGGLAALRSYRSMRVSSEDRAGNADFLRVGAGETTTIAQLEGPGEITHLWTTIATPDNNHLRTVVFRIYWDNNDFPSVEAPIGDFYGLGHGKYYYFNNPVQAIGTDRGMNAFWPMPFARSARVEITNESDTPINAFYYYVDWRKFDRMPENLAYFHAQYRQEHPATDGKNYLIAQTQGGPGHFVGVSMSIHTQVGGWWGEGDDIFTIDNETRPSLWGTGSEDYFCGAWCYGAEFFNDYFGMPLRQKKDQSEDNYWNVYRHHLESPITFTRSLKVEIEHGHDGVSNTRGGKNNNYSSVAYYYVASPQRLVGSLPPAAERIPGFTPPPVPEGVIEAHRMERPNPAQGLLEEQDLVGFSRPDRTWLNNSHLWRRNPPEGDETELTFEVKKPMKGPAVLLMTAAPDYGRFRIALDHSVLHADFNAYSTEVEPVRFPLGELELAPGRHTLTIKTLGKDARSSGRHWGIDYLRVGGEPLPLEKNSREVR